MAFFAAILVVLSLFPLSTIAATLGTIVFPTSIALPTPDGSSMANFTNLRSTPTSLLINHTASNQDNSHLTNSTADQRQRYIIKFEPATSLPEYRHYVASLPDHGTAWEITAPGYMVYITNLTEAEVSNHQNDPLVKYIVPDQPARPGTGPASTGNIKRADSQSEYPNLWRRDPAQPSLKLLSKDGRFPESMDFNSYLFHPSQGSGITIYFIDTGIKKDHNEFEDRGPGVEIDGWVMPNYLNGADAPDEGPDALKEWTGWNPFSQRYDGHGTGVASLAAGKNLGVASKANIVMVKFSNGRATHQPPPAPPFVEGIPAASGFHWVFGKIIDDVESKGLQRKAVVNVSLFIPHSPDPSNHVDSVENAWSDFLHYCKINEVMVVSSGTNYGNRWYHGPGFGPIQEERITLLGTNTVHEGVPWTRMHEIPGRLSPSHPEMLMVGGINVNGSLSIFTSPVDPTKQDPIAVYASADVIAASPLSRFAMHATQGVSFSAALVSGLVAYVLGLPDSITNLANSEDFLHDLGQIIKSYAWQRIPDSRQLTFPIEDLNYHEIYPDDLPAAYNGVWRE